jgi:hypothetical protein
MEFNMPPVYNTLYHCALQIEDKNKNYSYCDWMTLKEFSDVEYLDEYRQFKYFFNKVRFGK